MSFQPVFCIVKRSMWHSEAHSESLKTTCFFTALVLHFRSCSTAVLLEQEVTHGISPNNHLCWWRMNPNTTLAVVGIKQQLYSKDMWVFLLQPQPQQAPAGRQGLWCLCNTYPGPTETPWATAQQGSSSPTTSKPHHALGSGCFRPVMHFGRLASGGSNAPAYN